jgi:hypothetical protein
LIMLSFFRLCFSEHLELKDSFYFLVDSTHSYSQVSLLSLSSEAVRLLTSESEVR